MSNSTSCLVYFIYFLLSWKCLNREWKQNDSGVWTMDVCTYFHCKLWEICVNVMFPWVESRSNFWTHIMLYMESAFFFPIYFFRHWTLIQVNLCEKFLFLHQLTHNIIWQQIVHGITSSVHETTSAEHGQNMFLPCSALVLFMFWTGNSMNNLL